jgi:hypothetical protein
MVARRSSAPSSATTSSPTCKRCWFLGTKKAGHVLQTRPAFLFAEYAPSATGAVRGVVPVPRRGNRNRVGGAPFAPLGRGVVGRGDPGFRSAPPWAFAVRRVAARAGVGCMSGGCVPYIPDHGLQSPEPAVTAIIQNVTSGLRLPALAEWNCCGEGEESCARSAGTWKRSSVCARFRQDLPRRSQGPPRQRAP